METDEGTENYIVVVRLVLEGLVLALVLAFWLWGTLTLGSRTVASETHSPMVQTDLTDVVVCPAPDTSEKAATPTAAGEDADCPPKVRPHTTTSRQPGAGLARQEHRGDS
jgi:hypothetical protein